MSVVESPKTKPIYLSRTFWLNIAGFAIIVLQLAIDQTLIPAAYQGVALAALNIMLRFVTTKGVSTGIQ